MPTAGRKALITLLSRAVAPVAAAVARRARGVRSAREAWVSSGFIPMAIHYYSPVFDPAAFTEYDWASVSSLSGIDWREVDQLELLDALVAVAPTLDQLSPYLGDGVPRFDLANDNYGPGDAEVLYAMIRRFRPQQIVEVGSGWSTLVAHAALLVNQREGCGAVRHVCIEPYEVPWLERVPNLDIVRSRVETTPAESFDDLESGDLLFIDSSHVVRFAGDVVFLYLEVLPRLPAGVLVHVHDVFLPRAYPRAWSGERWRFWTEQYLLQALLVHSTAFRVLLALNHLAHTQRDSLGSIAPSILADPASEPGSFWMQRTGEATSPDRSSL